MTATTTDRAREQRVRRAAKRQGLELRKYPSRDPRELGFGHYTLSEGLRGWGAAKHPTIKGRWIATLTLDDVERLLSERGAS